MPDCCGVGDLDDIFTPAHARRDAQKYRQDGLDAEAARIAQTVRRLAGDRLTVLEIGGSIGAIQLELLRAGATAATNVEISGSYEPLARELATEAGVSDRIERRVGDFVAEARTIPAADAVILQRVVCCYPDADALTSAAAEHTRRVLVMTMPRDVWFLRLGVTVINVWPRLRGWKFRAYVHPTRDVIGAAMRKGLRMIEHRPGFVWQMLVLAREAPV